MKMLRALSLALILSVPAFMNATDDDTPAPAADASANSAPAQTAPATRTWSDKLYGFADSLTSPVDLAADFGDWVEGKAKNAAGSVENALKFPYRNYRLTTKSLIFSAVLAVATVVAKRIVDCNKDARFECEDCDN